MRCPFACARRHCSCAHVGTSKTLKYTPFASTRSLAPPAAQPSSRRRRSRHQHFWRNADKMPEQHRLFVESSDVAEALERGAPVTHVQARGLGKPHMPGFLVRRAGQGTLFLLERQAQTLPDALEHVAPR